MYTVIRILARGFYRRCQGCVWGGMTEETEPEVRLF